MPGPILMLAALALAGCGSDGGPSGPDPDPGGPTGGVTITLVFPDSALQSAVEEAVAAVGSAEELVSLSAKERGIAELDGIEQLTQLEVLDLYGNEIRDLSPLAGLDSLQSVDLTGNEVTDVSALAGLDSLQSVDLTGNPLGEAAVDAQVAALRERGVTVDFAAPEGTEGMGDGVVEVVLGELPIVFASSRRTGLHPDQEVYSLDPKTGVVVNLSEDLAAAPLATPDSVSLQRRRHGEGPAQSPDRLRLRPQGGIGAGPALDQ